MKVYIVQEWVAYEGSSLLGIWSSEEKAREHIKKIVAEDAFSKRFTFTETGEAQFNDRSYSWTEHVIDEEIL